MSKLDEDDLPARNVEQKSLSPVRDISPVSSSDSEVEVDVDDRPSSPLPIVEVTSYASPPQAYQKRSKNSELFSVDALLGPDIPRQRNKLDHNHSSYQPAFAETIAVTRSFLYPSLAVSDLAKDGKEISPSAIAVLPRRSVHNFGNIPHGLHSMRLHQKNASSPNGTPVPPTNTTATMAMMSVKDNVDFLDANRNFLAGSLYLSLGAVQAAAAAAIVNPSTTNLAGKCTLHFRVTFYYIIIFSRCSDGWGSGIRLSFLRPNLNFSKSRRG